MKHIAFDFRDGEEDLVRLTNWSWIMSNLLFRLLSENHKKLKVETIIIYFCTELTYQLFPKVVKYNCHFRSGMLIYHDVFDRRAFEELDYPDRRKRLWELTHKVLADAGRRIGDNEFLKAVEHCFHEGLRMNLCPDYKTISAKVELWGRIVDASIWAIFEDDCVRNELLLEYNGSEIYRQELSRGSLGLEFNLIMFRKIEYENNAIIVKVHREANLKVGKIAISESLFHNR